MLRRGELVLTVSPLEVCACVGMSTIAVTTVFRQHPLGHLMPHCPSSLSLLLHQPQPGRHVLKSHLSGQLLQILIYLHPLSPCRQSQGPALLWFGVKMALEGASLRKGVRLHNAVTYLKESNYYSSDDVLKVEYYDLRESILPCNLINYKNQIPGAWG